MQEMKINLKKENHLYKLNIKHDELIKPFNFLPSDINKIMKGKMEKTTTITYRPNKDGYETTLRLYQDTYGIFNEEFQIELEISGETYQAFYSTDEDGYVYLTKYEYLELVKIFEKIDFEVETNLIDLRVMGVDFLSNLLSTAFYQNQTFGLEMTKEDYEKTGESIKEKTIISYEDVIAQGLINGKEIRIFDYEEDREYFIKIDKLQEGLEILKEDYPRGYSNIISDEYDLIDADALIQCALFGEVVYG